MLRMLRPFDPMAVFRLAVYAVLLLAVLIVAGPAYAQDSGGGLSGGWIAVIITTAIGLIVTAFGTLWSLFVSYAAKSEATWDDAFVRHVRGLAAEVVRESQSPTTPIPPAPPATTAKT